jgi:NDP-sugar pyrophosphorylase family protein
MNQRPETGDQEAPPVRTAALIAAGHGERLRGAGLATPKPLVPIAGIPLIERVLRSVAQAGIHEVACILNAETESDAVEDHCRRVLPELQLHIVRQTTASSMESVFALAPQLHGGRFLLLTVDAVFGPAVLPLLLQSVTRFPDADGVLGVHDYIDDEKPLRLRVDTDGHITAIGPKAGDSGLITAGLYVFAPRIFAEIDAARAAGCGALRGFLAHLCERGYRLHAARLPKTVDVDRPEDIAVAEAFVRGGFAESGSRNHR